MTPSTPTPAADAMYKLTDFQKRMLEYASKGMGIDARPSQLLAWQRRELDELVRVGLLRMSKNHSKDKYGCYSK